MSSLYVTEPPTFGKVLISTNRGEIEIELWSKEAPKAVRNFVQLCLEGYYIDTLFHRIVAGFLIQGGDPTATGTGGQSIYDDPFPDEVHSRLRYNRRGLLGMANHGKDDNGSQFFITLDATPELQGKHTLFGRVMGDTIYNIMKMGTSELVPDSDRPLYPPRVTKTEVLVNPFPDIVPRTTQAGLAQRKAEQQTGYAQRKDSLSKRHPGRKNKKLLSFAVADEGDDEGGDVVVSFKPRIKSSHDVPAQQDVRLSSANTGAGIKRKRPSSVVQDSLYDAPVAVPAPAATTTQPQRTFSSSSSSPPPPSVSNRSLPVVATVDAMQAQIAALKSSLKRHHTDTTSTTPPPPTTTTTNQTGVPEAQGSLIDQQRQAYHAKAIVGGRRRHKGRTEDDTLSALSAFTAKLSSSSSFSPSAAASVAAASALTSGSDAVCHLHGVPKCQSCRTSHSTGEPDGDDDDDGDKDWFRHELVFEADKLGKDERFRDRARQELEIIDPREKAGRLALRAREERRSADAKSGRNQYLHAHKRR